MTERELRGEEGYSLMEVIRNGGVDELLALSDNFYLVVANSS